MASLRSKDLLDVARLSVEELELILGTALAFKQAVERPVKKAPTLRGKTVVHLFAEPSARTRSNFESAGKLLGADNLGFPASSESGIRGESPAETARKLEAMSPDFVVIRHPSAGAPDALGRLCRSSIINAGDGMHEHPTRALRDALAVRGRKKSIAGLRVAIIGDIAHSRSARSGTILFRKMGADVCACGPPTMIPCEYAGLGAVSTGRIEEALEGADVVLVLPLLEERLGEALVPSTREYFNYYGLTRERMHLAKPDAAIMHPGPLRRGVEIDSELADRPDCIMPDSASDGIAVCAAVLYLLGERAGRESGNPNP